MFRKHGVFGECRCRKEKVMVFCSSCGHDKGSGTYCPNCGSMGGPTSPQGSQPNFPPPLYGQQPQFAAGGYRSSKDRTTAALLAIFIGGLGIHKFYLGGQKQKTAGIIQIVVTLLTCGFGAVIPLIEGILYFTKDDNQFQYEYVQGGKDWF